MTQKSQEDEFNVLGCKVRLKPDQDNGVDARMVINLVNTEVENLKKSRPQLRDTDIAVLVALKLATEKFELEDEYKQSVLKLEQSLESALHALNTEVN